MSDPRTLAARMAVEHATAASSALLRAADIPCVALRGPALVRLLYDDSDARASLDVDLLVPELRPASDLLVADGYELVVDWTPGMERHAWTHAKGGAISIDLHRTLVGIEADEDVVWRVFVRESDQVELLGGTVEAPVACLQALTVALHAAQHGSATEQTTTDLARALDRFDARTWERAAELARELDAEAALAAGLSQLPAGGELARTLGVEAVHSRRAALRADYGSAEPAVLGIDTMLTLRGRRRVAFALGKLVPSAAFMRERHALARRGRTGLAVAYVYRAGWILWRLPRALMRVRAAARRRR